jgi:hypothetical protein
MGFKKVNEADRVLVDGRTVSTKILIMELVERVHDENLTTMGDDIRAVMWCSARRLHVLYRLIDTLGIGLIVTNALWFAHWMGWF